LLRFDLSFIDEASREAANSHAVYGVVSDLNGQKGVLTSFFCGLSRLKAR